MTTAATTKSEFTAFVVALVERKESGALLTATLGGYRFEIATSYGTYRITTSGGPLGEWTRRQGITTPNVAETAAALWSDLHDGAEQDELPVTETPDAVTEVQAARTAVAEAANARRLYGTSGTPAVKARTAAREAIYRALRAGATERDILAV
jgi:hypothetical protein